MTSHASTSVLRLFARRALGGALFSTGLCVALVPAAGCASQAAPSSGYEEYQCPDPVGRIIREDCAQSSLRYDGTEVGASLGVGPANAEGTYRDQAVRQANDIIGVLKEQRTSLCHDFNTCKLTLDQYRHEKSRIESVFTAVVAMKENTEKMDATSALAYLEQIRQMREGPSGAAPPPLPPPTQPVEPPPVAPPLPSETDAEWGPGKYMMQAAGRVAEAAKRLEAGSDYGFDIDHACLLGAYLIEGKSVSMTQSFEGGREYVLLGGGTDSANDVDLAILDEQGTIVISDVEDDATPVLRFTPPTSGNYRITLALADSKAAGNFVAVAVMHKGGYTIPEKNLMQSFQSAYGAGSFASKRTIELGLQGLAFHEQGNWSLYGTVLKPGEKSSFGGLSLVTDPTVVLAGGDGQAPKLDISVEEMSGTRVAGDSDTNARPVAVVHPDPSKRYRVGVANTSDAGVTLVTVMILDAMK